MHNIGHLDAEPNEPENPFDFEGGPPAVPADEALNPFQLDKTPLLVWGQVYRGLGFFALAGILAPAIIPISIAVGLLILIVGAIGLITVQDLQQWILPGLLAILWFVPCIMGVIRAFGAFNCLTAPSRKGLKGLAVGLLSLNILIALIGSAIGCLGLGGYFMNWPLAVYMAYLSLAPYLILTVLELAVSTVFLLQLGRDIHSISFVQRVGRFGILFAFECVANGLFAVGQAIFSRSMVFSFLLFLVVFLTNFAWYLKLLSEARTILARLYRLNARGR